MVPLGLGLISQIIHASYSTSNYIPQEEHLNTLVYQLPMAELQLHKVFETMEQGRQSLDIQVWQLERCL